MSETATTSQEARLIEHGDPGADGRAFRRSLGQYPTGVAVITARHRGKLLGMVVRGIRPDNDPYYNTYYQSYFEDPPTKNAEAS